MIICKRLFRLSSALAFTILIIAANTRCTEGKSSEQFTHLQDEIKRGENFSEQEEEILIAIKSNFFDKADTMISNLETSEIASYFNSEIEELKFFNNERKLYIKIKKYKNVSDIESYEREENFNLYTSEINAIKAKIEEDLYLAASKNNSIVELNYFIENYPKNSYRSFAKSELIELNRKREQDSIRKEIEFQRIMEKYSDINKKTKTDYNYYGDSYIEPLRNYSSSSSYTNTYQNPCANPYVIEVKGYTKENGTYVAPHVRTAPNKTTTDNLNYKKQ